MDKSATKTSGRANKGNTGKSSTSKKGAKKEFSKRPDRATKQKGNKMIIPAETVMRKIGQLEKGPKHAPKAAAPSGLHREGRGPAKATKRATQGHDKGGSKTATKNWRARYPAILKAFEDAPADGITQAVCAVLETLVPAPTTWQVGELLEEAGIPDHARAWIRIMYEDPKAKKNKIAQEADRARRVARDAAKGGGKALPHVEKVFGPAPLGPLANIDQASTLPQVAEECPAYLKSVFDAADPEQIARDTGRAADALRNIWSHAYRGLHELCKAAGIPKAWHLDIGVAATRAEAAREQAARTAETERRRQAQAPAAAEAPKPKAEARDPFGEALKLIVDSGYAVSVNGKAMDLRGLPLWQREGVCIQPGEIRDLRAQVAVVIGLVDGLTNLLPERDPEDRETRKLSALREQVDNLIGLLDSILTGRAPE